MKKKSIIIGIVLTMTVAAVLGGFALHQQTTPPQKDDDYLAGGTIPKSAKLYDILDEDMPMVLQNFEENQFSDEDVATITHNVDLIMATEDTRNTIPGKENYDFLTSKSYDDLMAENEIKGLDYAVHNVQIFNIRYDQPTDMIWCTTATRVFGRSASGAPGDRDMTHVNVIKFKQINGKWFEYETTLIGMWETGTVTISRDYTTGKITLEQVKE